MAVERIQSVPTEPERATPHLARNFDVLTPQAFLHDFAQRAKAATGRVWVQGMYMYPGKCADAIAQSLRNAASRHVDSRLCVDYYNLMVTDGHANLTYKFTRDKEERDRFNQRKRTTAALHAGLMGSGVNVDYTNISSNPIAHVLPIIGRNHDKVVIVDNVAYVGGLNYGDDVFDAADFMVVFEDPAVVETLLYLFIADFEHKSAGIPDREIPCGDDVAVLIDGGRPGKSLILDKAVALGRNAKSRIRFASPYLPDGKLQSVLNKTSQEGVDVEVVVSPYTSSDKKTWFWLANRATQLATGTKKPHFPINFHDFWVHAKLFIVDDKVAIFGSHNLLTKGVLLGTRERSIVTSNPTLVENLVQYFNDELLTQSHPVERS